jgi:hypothetical protein
MSSFPLKIVNQTNLFVIIDPDETDCIRLNGVRLAVETEDC